MLSHMPHFLGHAADMGMHAVFAGHTHGGQIRLPTGHALVNSTDLPLHLTSGLLRHRDTLAAVSRGVGVTRFPLRLFCPAHVPIYNLRRGPMPGEASQGIVCVRMW
jgi:predicted MPP superfamily phosphohydrolase